MTVLVPARRPLHAWRAGMEPGKAPEHHSGERWSQEYTILRREVGDAGTEALTYLGVVISDPPLSLRLKPAWTFPATC